MMRLHATSAARFKALCSGTRFVKQLVHRTGRLKEALVADDLGRNTSDRDGVLHRLHNDRPRCDARAMANLNVAENFRAGADHHAAANLGMAVLVFLAGAAERDVMEDRNIIVDYGGLTDHKSCGVIEEDALADPGCR